MISELCVDKKFQNRGFGSEILKKSQEITIKDQLSAYLLCDQSHIKFYKSHDWKLINSVYTSNTIYSTAIKLKKKKICFFYNLKKKLEKIVLIGKAF